MLLTAFAHWGPGCLERLVGMFAFAVLDTRDKTVFLARDYFGIKPLYVASTPGGLVFASEIGALLELGQLPRTVDAARLFAYLRYGITDHGDGSLFAEVQQVPAGGGRVPTAGPGRRAGRDHQSEQRDESRLARASPCG